MKIKNILTLALALPVMAAFVACHEDEADYTAATVPAGSQVYFSDADPSSVLLENGQETIDVTIYRNDAKDGALEVGLKATADPSIKVQCPKSVKFAEDALETTFKATFDFTALEADKDYDILFEILADTTFYGPKAKTISIKYAPWTPWCFTLADWKDQGQKEKDWPLSQKDFTGSYTYDCIWGGADDHMPISYRVSLTDPTKAQFRFGALETEEDYEDGKYYPWWGNGTELFVDCTLGTDEEGKTTYTLAVPAQYTEYDHSSYGPMYASDGPNMYYNLTGKWPAAGSSYSYEVNPCTFDPELGIFTLNLIYFVEAGYIWSGCETFYLDGYVRKDFSMTLSYQGGYIAPNETSGALVSFTMGADVASYKYVLVEGILTEEEVDSIATEVDMARIDAEESKENGYKVFPMETEKGDYTVVVLAYDSDDKFQKATALSFTYEFVGGAPEWESIGMCTYVDDIIGPLFSADPVEYEVEVQANTKTPGLYRMVNPYGECYPYNEPGDWDDSQNYYVVIDATNPSQVFFDEQCLGLDWGQGGFMWATSYASYLLAGGNTAEEIAEAGLFGTLENGIITFPVKGILVDPGNGTYYLGNSNGAFKLDLNGVANAKAKKANAKHASHATTIKAQAAKLQKNEHGIVASKAYTVSASKAKKYAKKALVKVVK